MHVSCTERGAKTDCNAVCISTCVSNDDVFEQIPARTSHSIGGVRVAVLVHACTAIRRSYRRQTLLNNQHRLGEVWRGLTHTTC